MANKPYCIISTVGSSLLRNRDTWLKEEFEEFNRQHKEQSFDLSSLSQSDWRADQSIVGHLYRKALSGLQERLPDVEKFRRATAELNVIDRILRGKESDSNLALHFLATETAEGVLVARILRDFCKEAYGGIGRIHIIKGLQIDDGHIFRMVGVPTLVASVYDILRNWVSGTYQRIFNATGGFKGVIPYLTVIGMLEGDVELHYMYEQSTELIRLAPLPVKIDFETFTPYLHALEQLGEIHSDQAVKSMLGLANAADIETHSIWALLDWFDDEGTRHFVLNGLGRIVYKYLLEQQQCKIWLSVRAYETYKSLDATTKRIWDARLAALRNEGIRRNRQHATIAGLWKVDKVGKTAERPVYRVLEDENIILVAELVTHTDGSYERLEATLRNNSYEKQYQWA